MNDPTDRDAFSEEADTSQITLPTRIYKRLLRVDSERNALIRENEALKAALAEAIALLGKLSDQAAEHVRLAGKL